MTLNVGVDASVWTNRRGDGRFVRNAVRALVEGHPHDRWTLVADPRTAEDLPSGARVRVAPLTGGAPRAGAARGPADLARLARAARGFDAFLQPTVYSWHPVPGPPTVLGVYDATSVTHAGLVLPSRRDRMLWRLKLAAALRTARRVFTLSEAARQQLAEHLGLDPDRVAVVRPAPDPAFARQPEAVVEEELTRLGLDPAEGLILFSAGISPHKGLETLLDAYAALRTDAPPLLVIVGDHGGPYASAGGVVARQAAALGPRVRLPGFVSDRALAALYTASAVRVGFHHRAGPYGQAAADPDVAQLVLAASQRGVEHVRLI